MYVKLSYENNQHILREFQFNKWLAEKAQAQHQDGGQRFVFTISYWLQAELGGDVSGSGRAGEPRHLTVKLLELFHSHRPYIPFPKDSNVFLIYRASK